ncbi:hypothetical protein JXA80_01400 [bacterium]|nr:hypothetical protein [candidate division CSSED10-310 bacterium]
MPSRWPAILLLLISLFASAPGYINDDAVISYRYAWNMARGYGPATWPGGPPEEGFSNPLLVWMAAAGAQAARWTGANDSTQLQAAITTGILLNLLAAVALLLLTARWSGIHDESKYQSGTVSGSVGTWIAPVVLALAYPLAWYIHSGLETPLIACLYTFMCAAWMTGRWKTGAVFGVAAAATRPEGILIAACVLVAACIAQSPGYSAQHRNTPIRGALILVGGFALLVLWRWLTFDHLLPTPLLVKTRLAERGVFDGRGWRYLIANLRAYPLFTALLIPAALETLHFRRFRSYLPVTALIIAQTGFTIGVGGDEIHLGASRFILPMLPVLCITGVCGIVRISNGGLRRSLSVGLIVISFLYYNALEDHWRLRNDRFAARLAADPMTALQTQWNRWTHPRPWIDADAGRFMASIVDRNGCDLAMASVQAGSLPIAWQGEFIDLIGLTTRAYAGRTNEEKDVQFELNPPDIVMAFRWEGGWFDVPSVAALKRTGFNPVILIRLHETIEEGMGNAEFVINFMVFVRDVRILTGLRQAMWDGEVAIAYTDGRDTIHHTVLLKNLCIHRGVVTQ